MYLKGEYPVSNTGQVWITWARKLTSAKLSGMCSPLTNMTGRVYETLQGFFVQDNGYDGSNAILPHLGLLDTSNNRWDNTIKRLKQLNENAKPGEAFKLIIAGRHGQGFHNVAEEKYGTKRWNEYWAKLDGDGEIVWGPDPLLTKLGEDQARDANAIWTSERNAGMPLPDGLYSSPMTRALRTLQLTFDGIIDFTERRPLVLENAREIYGVHSCDMRRTRSYIESEFPEFAIEDGFTEKDELYDPNVRETYTHVAERAHSVLDYIFEHDDGLVISLTSHSAFIRGLVVDTKHRPVDLPTGGILPIVVKGTLATTN